MTYVTGTIATAVTADALDRLVAASVADSSSRQGEIVKKIGLALLMATLAPTAFAVGTYSEVWNPPEARGTMPKHVKATRKTASHRRLIPHTLRVHARRVPTTSSKLVAKQHNMPQAVPATEPDISDIPRQITPEGNVLRVTGHRAEAEVTR
jgi:hypothetical protein